MIEKIFLDIVCIIISSIMYSIFFGMLNEPSNESVAIGILGSLSVLYCNCLYIRSMGK